LYIIIFILQGEKNTTLISMQTDILKEVVHSSK